MFWGPKLVIRSSGCRAGEAQGWGFCALLLVSAPCRGGGGARCWLLRVRSETDKTAGTARGGMRSEVVLAACGRFRCRRGLCASLEHCRARRKNSMHPHVNRTAAWRGPAFWPRNVVKYRRAASAGLIYLRATDGERITARRSTQGARTPVVRSNKPVPLERPRGLIAARRPSRTCARPTAAPPRAAEAARAAAATNKDARRPRALRRGLRYY